MRTLVFLLLGLTCLFASQKAVAREIVLLGKSVAIYDGDVSRNIVVLKDGTVIYANFISHDGDEDTGYICKSANSTCTSKVMKDKKKISFSNGRMKIDDMSINFSVVGSAIKCKVSGPVSPLGNAYQCNVCSGNMNADAKVAKLCIRWK